MQEIDLINRLHNEISDKAKEYQRLLHTYQNDPPLNPAELFKLKRTLITVSREKTRLIDDFKRLSQ